MNIKRNIIFALERRKKDGVLITENVPIRMRVIYNSKRIEIATGYRIDASKWDSNLQQVKKEDAPINSSNQLLRSMQTCRDMDLKCRRYSRSLKLRS